jgi:hypothetical protein
MRPRTARHHIARPASDNGFSLVSILLSLLILGLIAGGAYAGLSGTAGNVLGGWFNPTERLPAEVVDAAGGDSSALEPIGGAAPSTGQSLPAGTLVVTCRTNVAAVESAVQQQKIVLGRLPSVDELRAAFAEPVPFGPVPDPTAGYAILYSPSADGTTYELIGTWANGDAVGRC